MYEGLCKTINLIFGRTIKLSSVIKIVTLIMSPFVHSLPPVVFSYRYSAHTPFQRMKKLSILFAPSIIYSAPCLYLALYDITPSYEHLRVFDCVCYPNLSAQDTHKLPPSIHSLCLPRILR
jgi:hypothetical protein